MEIWKDIQGYEGLYMVSNLGRVKSLPRKMKNGVNKLGEDTFFISKEKFLKERIAKDDSHYASVSLRKNNSSSTKHIHRLVAIAFIPNDDKRKTQVNHIDENKLNNRLDNLEWMTPQENTRHNDIHKRKGDKRSKPVIGFYPNGDTIIIMTARESRGLGFNKDRISAVCDKENRTYRGIKWKSYKSELTNPI